MEARSEIWTHDQLKAHKWTGQKTDWAQVKENGWRATMFRQPPTHPTGIQIFGRQGPERPDLEFTFQFPYLLEHPDVKAFLKNARPFTSVDMEIVASGERCSDVTTHLSDSLPVRIIPFAMPMLNGEAIHGLGPDVIEEHLRQYGLGFSKWMWAPDLHSLLDKDLRKTVETFELVNKSLIEKAKAQKLEGWMLKSGGQYGKWFKVKPEDPIDCVITGVKAGEGKYVGQIGSILCSVWDDSSGLHPQLKEIAKASGMTDAQRKEMTAMHAAGTLVGKVVQLRYQMVGSGGRLIHPRFDEWRPDKPDRQCTIDQLQKAN